MANYTSVKALEEVLNATLDIWCGQYGISVTGDSPSVKFMNLIIALHKKTGHKVVVLVDEYDKPMLQSLEDEGVQSQICGELKAFYGILKPMDEHVQFGFFHGSDKVLEGQCVQRPEQSDGHDDGLSLCGTLRHHGAGNQELS